MDWGAFLLDLLKIIGGLIVGVIIGFFVARKVMKKQLAENPPINEKMINSKPKTSKSNDEVNEKIYVIFCPKEGDG